MSLSVFQGQRADTALRSCLLRREEIRRGRATTWTTPTLRPLPKGFTGLSHICKMRWALSSFIHKNKIKNTCLPALQGLVSIGWKRCTGKSFTSTVLLGV